MKIKKDIKELNLIKNSLLIFFRKRFQNEIRDISNIIKDIQEKNLKNYQAEKTKLKIKELKELNEYTKEVDKVKDFSFFKVLYDEEHGADEVKRFNAASNKLNEIKKSLIQNKNPYKLYEENREIFNKIKEMLSNHKSKADIFINQMIDYFNIATNKNIILDLSLIIKSKMYEMDIKGIIYFFQNLNICNNKNKWIKKISRKNEELSEMTLEELKNNLEELRDNKIYDYKKPNINYTFFTCLYRKKEAIDFLLSKTNQDISALYDRIDPTSTTITIKNIQDTEECIKIFNKFKELNDDYKIFEYITTRLTEDEISKFEMYSNNYSSIIELERNDDSSVNFYYQVNNYIQDATFIFRQDNEDFSYDKKGITNMEELIYLKNQIPIIPPKETKKPKDELQNKYLKLVFFKQLISNLELIYETIKILRKKGSSLPILICIQVKYPEIEYILNKKKQALNI